MAINFAERKIKKVFKRIVAKIKEDPKWQLAILMLIISLIVLSAVIVVFAIPGEKIMPLSNYPKRSYAIDVNEFKGVNVNINKPQSKTEERKLDGLIVAAADANKLPICVMIENAAFSGVRPQSGLASASLVYEMIVEGGITRLMAVYSGEQTDPIGPVRSARDTYLEFASELDCMYTHAGGSYTASQALWDLHMKDLDALREPKYFWRDPNKVSPHNLFTKTGNLEEAAINGHSWKNEPTYTAWLWREDNKNRKQSGEEGYVSDVSIEFGGAYNVEYKFNYENNNYERLNGGVNHIDDNTGKVLTVRKVIVEKVPPGWYLEGKGRINFAVTGEGEAYIFQEGEMIKGKWKKPNRLARTMFYDEDGDEIEFVRGNAWIEIVPEGYGFTWQ